MARQARGEVVGPAQMPMRHGEQRCVRRAFLCVVGVGSCSGKSFELRREWILERLDLQPRARVSSGPEVWFDVPVRRWFAR